VASVGFLGVDPILDPAPGAVRRCKAVPLVVALALIPVLGEAQEDLGALAASAPDSVLTQRLRDHPDDIKETIRVLFRQSGQEGQGTQALTAAQRVAKAYALAWRDSFWVRQVDWFETLAPVNRTKKILADSLRLAGNQALGRLGIAAALALWRQSLRSYEAVVDSAGIGATLGNVGAGFYQANELDSAAAYFTRARTIAGRVGDRRTEGNAVGALASVKSDQGEPRAAVALYGQAAALRAMSGDDRGAAADRNNLGLLSQTLGDLDGAKAAFNEALASNRRAGRTDPAAANLINLGNLASLVGDYREAEARYQEAQSLYRASGNRLGVASVLHDRGLLALQRGDFRNALSILSQARGIFRVTGPASEELAVLRDLASTSAAMGNLEDAVTQLGRAERLAVGRKLGPQVLGQLALTKADLAVRFNRFPEAEASYRRGADLARRANDLQGLAEAERGLGLLELYLGNSRNAHERFVQALHTADRALDRRGAALTRLLLGYTQLEEQDTAGARSTLERSRAELESLGDSASVAVALNALGQLAAFQGAPLAAESLYRAGLRQLDAASAPTIAWPLHAGLAAALQVNGARDPAIQEWRAAVAEIERISGRIPLEERRAAFLADKWDVYAQLAVAEVGRGRIDAGFEASESLRARQLLDLLARGRIGGPGMSGDNDSLAGREQDLRRQITSLTRALEGSSDSGVGLRGPLTVDASAGAVWEALGRAQDSYADLLRSVEEARPEYAAMVKGRIATQAEVRQALAPDEALLEYLVGDSTSVVFVETEDTAAVVDLGVTRHDLAKLVDFSRGVLVRPGPSSAPAVWQSALRRLYQDLIEPVETAGLLRGKQALRIVPHAELYYLPFAALLGPSGPDAYLVQRYRLTYAPSASVWLRLRRSRAPSSGGGVLALAPRPMALPGSAAEVAAIGRAFGTRAKVLLGAKATKQALREAAAGKDIIHFATYGVLNKDNPLFSYVELMPGGEEDGRLEVHDVFGLPLRARLIVLSACQTGLASGALADVPAGDDWVGLVQAFLTAGASTVLATLWPVQDRSTAQIMSQLYDGLAAGETTAAALAQAQRTALGRRETAHPFFWAGFTLSGD